MLKLKLFGCQTPKFGRTEKNETRCWGHVKLQLRQDGEQGKNVTPIANTITRITEDCT